MAAGGPAMGDILFLVPNYPWPTTSGNRVRAASIAVALGELGTTTVLAPDQDGGDEAWTHAAERFRRRRNSKLLRLADVASAVVLGRHVVLVRAERAGLDKAFASIARRTPPSVVVLARPFFGPFVDIARAVGAVVVAEADESQVSVSRSVAWSPGPLPRRLRALFDLASAGRMEGELRRVDQVWVASASEIGPIRPYAGSAAISVIPNAVAGFSSPPRSAPLLRSVAFVGWYRHPPNEAAALELITAVMPAVRRSGGPRRLELIGRDPTARIRRAAAADPETAILGEVEDVTAALRSAGVLVMPIRSGGGTRIKAIEAVAAGVPIISTAFGMKGLGLLPEQEYLRAETPTEFAKALSTLSDADRATRLVTRAYARLSATASPAAVGAAVRSALAGSRQS